MPKHKQPSKEEMQQNIDASLEKLDKAGEAPKDKIMEEIGAEDPKEDPKDPKEEPKEVPIDPKEDPKEDPKDPEDPKEDPEDPKDPKFKKRYEDSSREAQVLYNKNKKMAEAIEKAGEVVEPTQEELTAKYSDWDTMSDFEKDMAKQNMAHDKQLSSLREATKDFKDMDAWNGKVDSFMADAETLVNNPDLEGKEEAFKLFSSMPTRRGVDFDVLVSSFLYESGKKVVKNKGSQMPSGTPGANKPKPNDGKLTLSQSRRLRTVNYKQYLAELKAGRIAVEE